MGLWEDFRFAGRLLLKDKWFSLVAAVALALGIGVNATVFTFVNAVLIRGLPIADPDRDDGDRFIRSRAQPPDGRVVPRLPRLEARAPRRSTPSAPTAARSPTSATKASRPSATAART